MYKQPYKIEISEKYKHKYKGNLDNIWIRSSWEEKLLIFLLQRPDIIEVACEELIVWYIKPTDGKNHRYYPDYFVKYKDKKNNIKKCIIEVKPFYQTQPPKLSKTKTGRKSKKRELTYKRELETYYINIAKWKATKLFCKNNNIQFFIVTDDPNINFKYDMKFKMWRMEDLIDG